MVVLSVVDVLELHVGLVATVVLELVTAVVGAVVELLPEPATVDAVVAGWDTVDAVDEVLELAAVSDNPVPEVVAEANFASKLATLSSKTSIQNFSSVHDANLARFLSQTFSTALRRSTTARSSTRRVTLVSTIHNG